MGGPVYSYEYTITLKTSDDKLQSVKWLRGFLDVSMAEALAEFHLMEQGKQIVSDFDHWQLMQWLDLIPKTFHVVTRYVEQEWCLTPYYRCETPGIDDLADVLRQVMYKKAECTK